MKVKGRSINKHHLLDNSQTCCYHLLLPYCYRFHYPYHFTVYMTDRTSSRQGSRALERSGHSDWPCEKQPAQRCTKAVRTTLVHILCACGWTLDINFPPQKKGHFWCLPPDTFPKSLRFVAVTRWAPQNSQLGRFGQETSVMR